jgi:hypothetical protein
MSTQLPMLDCQNEPQTTDPRLVELRSKLEAEGIDAANLVVLFLGGVDSVIGEHVRMEDDTYIVKNPKLLTRMTFQDRRSGEIKNELRFSDLDFLHAGLAFFNPVGGFFLYLSDVVTQLAYCNAYLGFLEGAKIAKAQEAGIVMPGNTNFPQR